MTEAPDINATLQAEGLDAVRERHDRAHDTRQIEAALERCHKIFKQWFGEKYDFDVLDVMLAVCASEKLPGDPAWLLIISGSGNAKTETVQASSRIGARVVSTLSSTAALLSASPRRERSRDATGGLLKEIGERGLLVIKDFTSILSSERNVRAEVLAALREIHDGHWVRDVGTDGGKNSIGRATSSSWVLARRRGTRPAPWSHRWGIGLFASDLIPMSDGSRAARTQSATQARKLRCARS